MARLRTASAERVTSKFRELRFDAGSLCLNLVATLGRRRGRPIERLESPERLAQWFAHAALKVAAEEIDQGTLAAAKLLREAMYCVGAAAVAGRPPPVDAVEVVNRAAAVPVRSASLSPVPTGVAVVGARGGLSGAEALSIVARDLISNLETPDWSRSLRECIATDCGMLYVDQSQGRRRRWCSMQRCGNRLKAARHRARTSAA